MPDDPTPLGPSSIYATLKMLAALCASISVTAGFLGSIVWYVISPRLRPYLDAIEMIPELAARLDELELRVPEDKVIIFEREKPFVKPKKVRAGDRVSVQYFLQRTDHCTTHITVRFWSYDWQAYDPRYTSGPHPVVRAPVTDQKQPFSVIIQIPEGMPPGFWAYAPEIVPTRECANPSPVYPPFADFEVVEVVE